MNYLDLKYNESKNAGYHKDHKYPDSATYKMGTYANICICDNCNLHGVMHDLWPLRPCPRCGGKVLESKKAAKYVEHEGVFMWVFSDV